jgi:hypothetical protein
MTNSHDQYPRQARERGWPTSEPAGKRSTLGERVAMWVGIAAALLVIALLFFENGRPLT